MDIKLFMMTPSNGNIFRVTDHLCGEFTGHWWISCTSPVNSLHRGQWRGALMFSLICAWIKGSVNNAEAGAFETPSRPFWRQCDVTDNLSFQILIRGFGMVAAYLPWWRLISWAMLHGILSTDGRTQATVLSTMPGDLTSTKPPEAATAVGLNESSMRNLEIFNASESRARRFSMNNRDLPVMNPNETTTMSELNGSVTLDLELFYASKSGDTKFSTISRDLRIMPHTETTTVSDSSAWESVSSTEEDYNYSYDYNWVPDPRVSQVYLVTLPIIFPLGFLGNTLSLAVMSRQVNRSVSTCVYLAMVAALDTLVMLTHIPWFIVYHVSRQTIDISTYAACTLDYFLNTWAYEFSAWMLLAVTADRYMRVVHPIRSTRICNSKVAIRICLALGTILASINIFHFVVYYPEEVGGYRYCLNRHFANHFVSHIWPVIDAFIYAYIPSFLMLLLNAAILRHMHHARHSVAQSNTLGVDTYGPSQIQNSILSKKLHQTKAMLFAITFAFAAFTVPIETYFIYCNFNTGACFNDLIYAILDILFVLNHAMNFYLYCLTARRFRNEVKCLWQGMFRRSVIFLSTTDPPATPRNPGPAPIPGVQQIWEGCVFYFGHYNNAIWESWRLISPPFL